MMRTQRLDKDTGKAPVVESADILIKAGMEARFEAAVAQAAPLFRRARGCRSMRLERCIERPRAYRLLVEWATLEDHTVHFRSSDDFQAWRVLVGDCFDGAPIVTHYEVAQVAF